MTARFLDQPAARCLGTALAVAACDPARALRGPLAAEALLVLVAAVAWWAAPMIDARPVRTSMRWPAIALRRRGTLLAAGSVVLAAATGPGVWTAACVTALLPAYLLATDPWTTASGTSHGRRPPAPALAAAAAAAVVFLAAQAPVAHTSWARLPAALAVAAAVSSLVLALRHRGPN